jgi:hypothetical protein
MVERSVERLPAHAGSPSLDTLRMALPMAKSPVSRRFSGLTLTRDVTSSLEFEHVESSFLVALVSQWRLPEEDNEFERP